MLNISLKKFITELSYIAVSRVRMFSELLFDETFDYERFNRITKAASKNNTRLTYRKADAERRSQQSLQLFTADPSFRKH